MFFATNCLEGTTGTALWTLLVSSVYLVLWFATDGLEASVQLHGKDVSSSLWLLLILLQFNFYAKIIWECCSGNQSRPHAWCNPAWKVLRNSNWSWIFMLWQASGQKRELWRPRALWSLSKDYHLACLCFGHTKNSSKFT